MLTTYEFLTCVRIYIANLEHTEIKIILLRMQSPSVESLNAVCILNMENLFWLQVYEYLNVYVYIYFDKYY